MKKYLAVKCTVQYWEEDIRTNIFTSGEPSETEQLIINDETTFDGGLFH